MKNKIQESKSNRSGAGSNLLRFFVFLLILHCSPGLFIRVSAQEPEPYDFRSRQAGYFGPEAQDPVPENLEEVLIAYFGPGDADHPEYGDFWTALKIAEKHLNEQGGYEGIPIRIKPVWTDDPWAGGISEMVRTFYLENVWALIGSVDSASTHLLEQISAKIRIPVLSPVSTDKSANLANVPWLFSLLPGDHILAEQLAEELEMRISDTSESFVVISGMDHDSRLFAREFSMQISEKKLVPEFMFEYDPDISIPWDRIDEKTKLFIVLAPPKESASLAREIPDRFGAVKIIGGPFMGRNRFKELCGSECPDFSYVSPGSCSPASDFAGEFRGITGFDPDYAECSIYDALMLLRDALKKSGLNRVLLMQEIRNITPWEGENGIITWDPLGQNSRQGSIQAGKNKVSTEPSAIQD